MEVLQTEVLQTFDILNQYPVQKKIIVYKGSTDEAIRQNILTLVPKIDYEYRKQRMTLEEQEEWLNTSKQYIEDIRMDFDQIYEKELERIRYYDRLNESIKNFDLQKMDKLPTDIIRYIYSYLPYETKYDMLKNKYSNISDNLMKLTYEKLKTFYNKIIYKKYYYKLQDERTIYRSNYETFMTKSHAINNKTQAVTKIMDMVETYRGIDPKDEATCKYFYKNALLMFYNIIYITKTVRKKEDEKIKKEQEIKRIKSKKSIK